MQIVKCLLLLALQTGIEAVNIECRREPYRIAKLLDTLQVIIGEPLCCLVIIKQVRYVCQITERLREMRVVAQFIGNLKAFL